MVLEGRGRFTVGAVEETLGPGEASWPPAGAAHGVANDGPEPGSCSWSRHAAAAARVTAPARAALMVTCLGDMFYPEVGERIVRLLRALGVAVDFPAGQTCCGLPLFNSGYHAEAAAVARRTVALFRDAEARRGAVGLVRVDGQARVSRAPERHPAERTDAERLAGRTYELSQFLVACWAAPLPQRGAPAA